MIYYRITRNYENWDRPQFHFCTSEELPTKLRTLASLIEEIEAPVTLRVDEITDDEYAHRGLIEKETL